MTVAINTFYTLTFKAFSNVAWANPPSMPASLAEAVRDGTPLTCFCSQDGEPFTIEFADGAATLPAAVVNVETPETTVVTPNDAGGERYSMRGGSGDPWIWRDSALGWGTTSLASFTTLAALLA